MDKNKLLNNLNIFYISYEFKDLLVLDDIDSKIEKLAGFKKEELLNNNLWIDIRII